MVRCGVGWVAIFLPPLISFVFLQTIDFRIWIPLQSCLHPLRIYLVPHLASTPIVDNSIPIVFISPYPPPYATPYILLYPLPCLHSYPTHSTSSYSSFNFNPIPRTTTIILMNLTLPPIITIHLPLFLVFIFHINYNDYSQFNNTSNNNTSNDWHHRQQEYQQQYLKL